VIFNLVSTSEYKRNGRLSLCLVLVTLSLRDKIFRKISENAELKIDYPCFSILHKGFGLGYEFA
jgi:hypothetical protein